MITNEQADLLLEQYTSRGVLLQEIRSYEVSLWTLLDSFITVLKWADVELQGRIEHPKMVLKTDGTLTFTFSVPMYYNFHGQRIENPSWYWYAEEPEYRHRLMAMRKIKVIFNKATADEGIFEFLITGLTESHENDELICEIECEGLAFHELGKIGYTHVLSQEVFEVDYNNWVESGAEGEAPIQSVNYWCEKIGLKPVPANNAYRSSSVWYYDVLMNWASFEGGASRAKNKIYEESYTSAWTDKLLPQVVTDLLEKARPVKIENSNIYNITQTIAEVFGVFCRYQYDYDENYHIIGRTIIFYNNFLKELDGGLTLTYPHSSTKISRTMDGKDLTTKLYISDVLDDTVFEGYHSIMNSIANPSRENYILNFDYLLKIGTISNDLYQAILPFMRKMRVLNNQLITAQLNLAAYQERKPKLEAKKTYYGRAIEQAQQLKTLSDAIKRKIIADYAAGDTGVLSITANNPERYYVKKDEHGNYIVLNTKYKGVIENNNLRIYSSYDYATKTLSNEITNWKTEQDDYGNVVRIRYLPYDENNTAPLYMTYDYKPEDYYEKLIKVWTEVEGKNVASLAEVVEELGDEDYDPLATASAIASTYATLLTALDTAIVRATVETDYYKRPHLMNVNINADQEVNWTLSTYLSTSYDNVLVTPILPNGEKIDDKLLRKYVATYLSTNTLTFPLDEVNGSVSAYTFADIFMGYYHSIEEADAAANAFHNYHEAVMQDNSNGILTDIKKTEAKIEGILNEKHILIREFETVMGPALREGYWQPENYTDFGIKLVDTTIADATSNNITTTSLEDTKSTFKFIWETKLQDDELDIFYYEGSSPNTIYYPCINLSSHPEILATLDEYSFVYNNAVMENNDETDIRNILICNYNSGYKFMYITDNARSTLYPALVILDARSWPTTELARIKASGHPRLEKITTTVLPSGTATTTISNVINITSDMWLFNNNEAALSFAAYPRIKFSSLALRTGTNDLYIHYNGKLLEKYTDYSILPRSSLTSSSDWVTAYYITLKPEVFIKNGGLGLELKVNFTFSNANTGLYLDGLKVSKENAEPRVSYDITPNLLGNNVSSTLYSRLAQIVMVNDTDLKFENVFGYISELELDLDDVTQDNIKILNYKTKFEDLFSSIIASTDAMKFSQSSLDLVLAGDIPLNDEAFEMSLDDNRETIEGFIQEYLDESKVIDERMTKVMDELGSIFHTAIYATGELQALSLENASILGSIAEDIRGALAPTVHYSLYKPELFKFGDVWVKTDALGNPTGDRFLATSSNDNGAPEQTDSWGFVQTRDGSLAEIRGHSLQFNTETGEIDILNETNINMKSGKDIYIAAGDRLLLVGNNSVNIGGTEINLCSLQSRIQDDNGNWVDGWETTDPSTGVVTKHYGSHLMQTTGINLIAGEYTTANLNNTSISKVLIRPDKVEFGSASIIMKAASAIEMKASSGWNAGTSAINIDAEKGIYIGAGKGIQLFGGIASDHISVGPDHWPRFVLGDIWIKTSISSDAKAHSTYDGNNAIESSKDKYYYSNLIRKSAWDGVFTIRKYRAKIDSTAVTSGMTEADIWLEDSSILLSGTLVAGASMELNSEHVLFGYNETRLTGVSNTVFEMTKEYILMSASENFDNMISMAAAGKNVTGFSAGTYAGLTGLILRRNSIGLAVDNPTNGMSIFTMNETGLTLASGIKNSLNTIDFSTASNSDIRTYVQNSNLISYVRVSGKGLELGSRASLFIQTANFKLVNNTVENAVMAFGAGANNITSSMALTTIELTYPNVCFAVNNNGVFFRGNGKFTGDVEATSLTITNGTHDGDNLIAWVDELLKLVDNEIDTWMSSDAGAEDPLTHEHIDDVNPYPTETDTTINYPANQWVVPNSNPVELDEVLCRRHLNDLYTNIITGATFKWVSGQFHDLANNLVTRYYWRRLTDATPIGTLTSNVYNIATGATGLAFTNSTANVYTRLNNSAGLVIIGYPNANGRFGTGWYPMLRITNNAMGFFYTLAPADRAAGISGDGDKGMMYFEDGDMYIEGTLYADLVLVKNKVGTNPLALPTLAQYVDATIVAKDYPGEILSKIDEAIVAAGRVLGQVKSTIGLVQLALADNNLRMQDFLALISNMQTTVYTQTTPPASFMEGDVWILTNEGGTEIGRYTAVVRSTDASVVNAVASNPYAGWCRTNAGLLAAISGTNIDVDGVRGLIDIHATSEILIRALAKIDILSDHLWITGNKSLNLGGKFINICSLNGGIYIANTSFNLLNLAANTFDEDDPNTNHVGTGKYIGAANVNYILIDKEGIVAGGTKVTVLAGNSNAGTAVEMNSSGLFVGTNGTIDISSSGEGVAGSGLKMLPTALSLWTVDDDGGSAISLTKDRIFFATGDNVFGKDDNLHLDPKTPANVTVASLSDSANLLTGVLIERNAIVMATLATVDNALVQSLVSITPQKVFIGGGLANGSSQGGSFVELSRDLVYIGTGGNIVIATTNNWFVIDTRNNYDANSNALLFLIGNSTQNYLSFAANGALTMRTTSVTIGAANSSVIDLNTEGISLKSTASITLKTVAVDPDTGETTYPAGLEMHHNSIKMNTDGEFLLGTVLGSIFFINQPSDWNDPNRTSAFTVLRAGNYEADDNGTAQNRIRIRMYKESDNVWHPLLSIRTNSTTRSGLLIRTTKAATAAALKIAAINFAAGSTNIGSIQLFYNSNDGDNIEKGIGIYGYGSNVDDSACVLLRNHDAVLQGPDQQQDLNSSATYVISKITLSKNSMFFEASGDVYLSPSNFYYKSVPAWFIRGGGVGSDLFHTYELNNKGHVKKLRLLNTDGNTVELNFTNANVLDHFMVTRNKGNELNVGAYDYTGVTTSNTRGRLAKISITGTKQNMNTASPSVRIAIALDNCETAGDGVSDTLTYWNSSEYIVGNYNYIDIDVTQAYTKGSNDRWSDTTVTNTGNPTVNSSAKTVTGAITATVASPDKTSKTATYNVNVSLADFYAAAYKAGWDAAYGKIHWENNTIQIPGIAVDTQVTGYTITSDVYADVSYTAENTTVHAYGYAKINDTLVSTTSTVITD